MTYKQTHADSTFYVSENPLEQAKVRGCWSMHSLTYKVDCELDIRSGDCEVLKFTGEASKVCRFRERFRVEVAKTLG